MTLFQILILFILCFDRLVAVRKQTEGFAVLSVTLPQIMLHQSTM
jgi:hypothetical protein